MDYTKIPEFIKQLHKEQWKGPLSPYAIEFLVLTGCRASEVTKMRWAEVDFGANMVWTLPSARTRSYREHRVPLSKYALALLNDQKNRIKGEDKYVWSLDGKRPISSKAVYLYLTRTMGLPYTLHGFRNSFRDWAGNETPFDRVTCELALAHKAGDATELAYRRSDALEKRRKLVEAWAEYREQI